MIARERDTLGWLIRKNITRRRRDRDGRAKKERRQGENNGGKRGAMADFPSLRLGESAEDSLHPHPVTEVRIDETRLDAAIRPHHERRRNRQQPAPVSLKLREIDAELQIGVLDLFAAQNTRPSERT
jgi:hypothetical protein